MLDLLLRHYRGAFDRIYLYSRSASLDKGWDPLRKYVEEVQHVNQDDEPTFFDEFDGKALQQQMDLQMRVAAYAKKAKHEEIPQVLWIFDDLVDDERVMHSNHNLIATLAIRSRHFGGNLWLATQKFRALANIIRVNLTGVFVWPALSNRLERKGNFGGDQRALQSRADRRNASACIAAPLWLPLCRPQIGRPRSHVPGLAAPVSSAE